MRRGKDSRRISDMSVAVRFAGVKLASSDADQSSLRHDSHSPTNDQLAVSKMHRDVMESIPRLVGQHKKHLSDFQSERLKVECFVC